MKPSMTFKVIAALSIIAPGSGLMAQVDTYLINFEQTYGPAECFRSVDQLKQCFEAGKLPQVTIPENVVEVCTDHPAYLKACLEQGEIPQAFFEKNYPRSIERFLKRVVTEYSGNHSIRDANHRCSPANGAGITNKLDSLNRPQGISRNRWSIQCVPYQDAQAQADIADRMGKMVANWDAASEAEQGKMPVYYPTYGKKVKTAGGYDYVLEDHENAQYTNWRAPTDAQASCFIPKGWFISGMCSAGCYTPDQRLLFQDGVKPIASASQSDSVVTLAEGATLDELKFDFTPVTGISKTQAEIEEEIVVISTARNRQVKVTLDHPLVMFGGDIRRAESLQVGDLLTGADGKSDEIVGLKREIYKGRVQNVWVASNDDAKNIVVAEGLLHGSAAYQNDKVTKLNQILLRRDISDDLITE